MELKLKFNEDANNYDVFRPRYCEKLFEDIFHYSKLNGSFKVLEVGIGTGQATTPFLKLGCSVTAIELGDKLAAFSKSKFAKYNNFIIHNIEFENYIHKSNYMDLIYSATAFHWIPEEKGYKKTYESLKSDGTLALFWNSSISGVEGSDIYNEIQKVYKEHGFSSLPTSVDIKNKYIKRKKTFEKYGFVDVEVKIYNEVRELNSREYICLLNTYSDHRSLLEDIKEKFEKDIIIAINKYGGKVKIYDTIDLYLGRKPKNG